MKKKVIKTSIEVYKKLEDLPKKHQRLLKSARKALKVSYSPYSKFQVGAAIELDNGKVLKGANYENASYPLCLCAERVAIAAASSQYPGVGIHTIAITAKSASQALTAPISPCGACRQVICETENKQKGSMKIILQGESGEVYVLKSGRDLLPLSFDGSVL